MPHRRTQVQRYWANTMLYNSDCRIMNSLVCSNRCVCISRFEAAGMRHLNIVKGRVEEGTVTVVTDLGRDTRKEGVDAILSLRDQQRGQRDLAQVVIVRQAEDLLGIKDHIETQKADHLVGGRTEQIGRSGFAEGRSINGE